MFSTRDFSCWYENIWCDRLEHIAGLEPLVNLRVLMLGKNRIRKVERITERHDHDHDHHLHHPETSSSSTSSPKVEGLTDCPKLSVLDLHGNRSYQQSWLSLLWWRWWWRWWWWWWWMGVIINIFNLGDAWGKLFANYWLHHSTQLSDRPCGNWLSLLWYIFGARQPLGQDFMIQFFSSCTLQHNSTQMNGSVGTAFSFLHF